MPLKSTQRTFCASQYSKSLLLMKMMHREYFMHPNIKNRNWWKKSTEGILCIPLSKSHCYWWKRCTEDILCIPSPKNRCYWWSWCTEAILYVPILKIVVIDENNAHRVFCASHYQKVIVIDESDAQRTFFASHHQKIVVIDENGSQRPFCTSHYQIIKAYIPSHKL